MPAEDRNAEIARGDIDHDAWGEFDRLESCRITPQRCLVFRSAIEKVEHGPWKAVAGHPSQVCNRLGVIKSHGDSGCYHVGLPTISKPEGLKPSKFTD